MARMCCLTSFHLALLFSFSNRRYSRRSSSSIRILQATRITTPMRNTPATVPPTISDTLGGFGHSGIKTKIFRIKDKFWDRQMGCSPWRSSEAAVAGLAPCLWQDRRSRDGIPLSRSTVTVYVSLPSSWTIWKDIQQFWESFSLHFLSFLLVSVVEFVPRWMLGQAWEQFFSKGPLWKNLHSTQELQNKRPQLTSAGAGTLSPGSGYSWALPKHRQGILVIPMPSQRPSLTCACCRVRGSPGTPGRRGAGTLPSTGSGCRGRSRGGCRRSCGC